jgi:photosystem II stability/assembly factor-like uncharacterized protein
MFIGIAGGGVWRSTDFTLAAPTWTPLTDHLPGTFPLKRQIGLQNIGALAVDLNNPWIIYAGTGDPSDRGPNAYGNGMLKSIDGGNTWTLVSVSPNSFAAGFSRIFVDPSNSSVVYATGAQIPNAPPTVTARSIFRSTDGGLTWSMALGNLPVVAVGDLDYTVDNSGNLRLLAAVNDASGTNPAANGVWQSTDAGVTWTQMLITPLTDLGSGGTVGQDAIGLLDLAVDHTPGTPNGAYLAISNGIVLMNVFKLVGNTWVPSGNGLRAVNTRSAQSIGIAPDGSVYFGGVNDSRQPGIFQTRDGGANWTSIDVGSNGVRPHTDQHAWAFFGGAVYNGNDGGVYRFTPLPAGAPGPGTWESLNTNSLQTILTEWIGIHPRYPNVMLQGNQDNELALRTFGQWKSTNIGEGARCRFDPFDGNFAYTTAQPFTDNSGVIRGVFFRSADGGASFADTNVAGVTAAQDSAPFSFHPDQPGRIALGLDRVFETRDRGNKWSKISGPRAGANMLVNALAYGGGDVIYVAYGGRLFKSTNDGGNADDTNWPELNQGNDWHGSIISIAVDPNNRDHVYLATDGAAIWRSADGGAHWTDITNDFPRGTLGITALDLRSYRAGTEATLFVSTSVGVYIASSTHNWSRLGAGLPDASVNDLQFNQTNKYLVAGIYGRGLFAAYMHFFTNVGSGAGALNDVVFCFAKGLDGRICVNQAQFGSAFSGWFELPGAGRTDAAPAATSVNNSIFCFVKGLDEKIYLNQAEFGHPFSGWFEVQGGGRTNAAPAAATIGSHVFVFVKGTDNKIYVNQADFGHAFGNWFELQGNGRTDRAAAAATLGQSVFVFIKGLDQRIYLNQAELGHAFSGWFEVQGGGLTDEAPTSAAIKDTLFVVVKGLDKKVYVNQARFGQAFQGWVELEGGGLTDAAPCAVAIRNSLFVFVRGLDGRIYLNQAELGHPFSGWFEVGGGIQ